MPFDVKRMRYGGFKTIVDILIARSFNWRLVGRPATLVPL